MEVYLLGQSLGLGISVAGAFWFITFKLGAKKILAPAHKEMLAARFKKFIPDPQEGWTKEDKAALACGLAGAALLALLGRGTLYVWQLFFVGVAVGATSSKGYFHFRSTAETYAKRRQVAVLFEAVELYLRCNMTVVQALYAAKSLTPLLSEAVKGCIVRWPANPENALENFRREIGVPEADVLVALLLRIHNSGLRNMEGVIQREAQNIEQLRAVAVRMKIGNRPLYFMLQRVLPTIATLGMFLGTMFYHLSVSLKASGVLIL